MIFVRSEIDNTQAIMQKFESMLNDLTGQELVVLNKMVEERIRLMNKATSLLHLTKFNVGDRVSWDCSDGIVRTGVIIRLNNKTASVRPEKKDIGKSRHSCFVRHELNVVVKKMSLRYCTFEYFSLVGTTGELYFF